MRKASRLLPCRDARRHYRGLIIGLGLCTLLTLGACKGGTASVQDTANHDWAEDVHIDSDSTVYDLFFWSHKYIEHVLHEMEAEGDTAGIDDLYIAMDDMVWYEAMCREWLEEQGATYYETDASKAVYYRGGVFRTKEESDWGVLVVEPGKEPVFMDYLNFIWTAHPSENISPQQHTPQQP